jgi:hypothetical protein
MSNRGSALVLSRVVSRNRLSSLAQQPDHCGQIQSHTQQPDSTLSLCGQTQQPNGPEPAVWMLRATQPHNTDRAHHAVPGAARGPHPCQHHGYQRRPCARADLTLAGRADNRKPVNWRPSWRVVGAPTLEVPLEPTLNKDELHLFVRHG